MYPSTVKVGFTECEKSYPAQRPTGTKPPTIGKGQAELTRERIGERGHPNGSWINVLSQAHRLCSALSRQSDLSEILESWGPEGRQKALSYLEPLYKDLDLLLRSLTPSEAPTTE
jgi:hypothetical protein